MLRASIILPIYNGEAYLPNCLEALKNELSAEDEVLVVDNASSDHSVEIIRQKFPWVHIIELSENSGVAGGCNRGAEQARGEFLVILNQDTIVQNGWLKGLLEPFEGHPEIGLVTSKLLLLHHPEKINLAGQIVHYTGLVFQRGWLAPASTFTQTGAVQAVSGASFAIRHQLWNDLGGFDESLFMYYEETDLCWRAWRRGYSSWCNPASIVYHDQPLTISARAVFYSERNRWKLLYKHWKPITRGLLLPAFCLAEIIEWSLLLTKGHKALQAKLRALGWWIGHFKKLRSQETYRTLNPGLQDWKLLEWCAARIQPQQTHAGGFGRLITRVVNFLFQVNYTSVLWCLRKLDI